MVSARTWLITIACLAALGGFTAGVLGDGTMRTELALGSIIVFPLYVLTYLWMKADARERASASPPGALPLVVALFPLAVPYHLIATRRGWGRGASMLRFLGFLVAMLALNSLAAVAGGWLVT